MIKIFLNSVTQSHELIDKLTCRCKIFDQYELWFSYDCIGNNQSNLSSQQCIGSLLSSSSFWKKFIPTNAQAKMSSIETLHQSNDYRYKLPSNVFTSTRNKDSCFCPKESHDSTIRTCPPTGTLNVSACNFGTPIIASFPHFYTGNESLFEKIVGLEPRQDRHESYIDLHPVSMQLLNIYFFYRGKF